MVRSSPWPSCVCLAAGAESVLQPRDANENPGIVRACGFACPVAKAIITAVERVIGQWKCDGSGRALALCGQLRG